MNDDQIIEELSLDDQPDDIVEIVRQDKSPEFYDEEDLYTPFDPEPID